MLKTLPRLRSITNSVLRCKNTRQREHPAEQNSKSADGVWLACTTTPSRPPTATERTARVSVQFGLQPRDERVLLLGPVRVPLKAGHVIVFLGPSGSGKSTALTTLAEQLPDGPISVQSLDFPFEGAVVDSVAPSASLKEAIGMMTTCGLSDPALWVRRFEELSEGERFRARLALGLSRSVSRGDLTPLLCDDFCSALHRRAAIAVSFNVRKAVSRLGVCLVAATSNPEILPDLRPDLVVRLHGRGKWQTVPTAKSPEAPITVRRELEIATGSKRDYEEFEAMHYRTTEELGFVDKVFLLRERGSGDAVGIVVYAHSPIELALRNQATDRLFLRNPSLLNRRMRILRRIVIHPDLRGCGLGHHLVRATLPQVGTDFVECLASMGDFNPVFEKAGMTRIGRCESTPERRSALEQLHSWGIDPAERHFAELVSKDRRVHEVVVRVVANWYRVASGSGAERAARQSPEKLAQTFRGVIASCPVYYLWRRDSHDR